MDSFTRRSFAIACALFAASAWVLAADAIESRPVHFAKGATMLRKVPKANVLWAPAVLWLAYAGWEAWVLAKTPEADIRIDLLLIWPLMVVVTLWALLRAARGWWASRRKGP